MQLIYDVIHALHLLRKTPWFTLLTVIVLAGGLSVSLFTFAFLYTFTSKPLPLPEQGTLYRASLYWNSDTDGEKRYLPAYEAARIREQLTVFAEHGIWQNKTVYLSLGENKLISSAVRASPNIFRVSRTQPVLGRTLAPEDSEAGQTPVVVIGYSLWQSQFGGAEDVIGKTLYINGVATEIIGVMPKGYRFPIAHELWLPIPERLLDPMMTDREKVEFFGRLKPGVTKADARARFFALAQQAFAARAALLPGIELVRSEVELFQQFDISTAFKLFAFALNLIALFILLLAAINVGNLLFARAIQRNKESAIRTALGAPFWRLVGQLMWEGAILVGTGTLLALVVVAWILDRVDVYLHSLMGNELAFWYRWEVDSTIIGAAAGFALVTVLAACFVPAVKAAGQDFNAVLRDGTRGAQSKSIGRISRWLVTLQIAAISIIMVLGTLISVKVHQATDLDLGFNYSNLYFSIVDLPQNDYPHDEDKSLFFERLQKELETDSAFSGVAVRFDFDKLSVGLDGVEYQRAADKPVADVYSLVGETGFMGPKLVKGRFLDERDGSGGAASVLISESMAERFWPQESPLGKRLQLSLDGREHWLTIVGVVSNVSHNPFQRPELYDEIYLSGYQFPAQRGTVFFRRNTDSASAEQAFFNVANRLDSQLDVLTIEDWELETSAMSKMTITFRDTIIVSGIFALLLALTGIYGLTAYSVERRSQEVGIRRALGATDRNILVLFVRQGATQLGIGLLVGIGLSALALMGIENILSLPVYAYTIIYLSVLVCLSVVVIASIVIPARKAVRLPPSVALRME